MKKTVKKDKLDIRLSVSEKNRLVKYAKQRNMKLSEYARMKLFTFDKGKTEQKILISMLLVKANEILNFVQEKYVRDESSEKLERMVEELWELVQS